MNRYEFYGNINTYRKNQTNKENELTHYGTLGQKWGVRKWQNPDGTFNEAGKKRYFGTGKFEPVSKEEQGDKINSKVNEIYKNYKPNDYNRALNQSDLSNDEWWKLKKELNKKLYTEDKKYSKIVNDENVKNALQEYLNTIDDTHKEEQRIYSEEFRKSNPKAENFDGDGTEFWYEFANKDIVDKGDKAYWNLREAVSKNSFKNGKWDHEILDKVMSDINEIVEKEQKSDKIYDSLQENMGVDFRNNEQKIGFIFNEKTPEDKFIKKNKKIINNINKALDDGDIEAFLDDELKFSTQEDWRKIENHIKETREAQGKNNDFLNYWMTSEDISEKMTKNAEENKGQKFREEHEKLELELLNQPLVNKHFKKMRELYNKNGGWTDEVEEYFWNKPELSESGEFTLNAIQNHIDNDSLSKVEKVERDTKIGSTKSNIPKKVYEANKNNPQSLKILEEFYKNHKDEPKDAKTKEIDKFYNDKEDSYMLLNQARKNLGLNSKKELTQADWDKINAEIKKIKKFEE